MDKNPSDGNLYGLALAYNKNNNFEDSIELLNKLIKKYPKNLVLNNTKVDTLIAFGKYKDALILVNKFLEISPKNYPLSISKSKLLLLTKKYLLEESDIIFDPLVFPAATGDINYKGSAAETIEGVRAIKETFPNCKTILGISNVSFGLPPAGREVFHLACHLLVEKCLIQYSCTTAYRQDWIWL